MKAKVTKSGNVRLTMTKREAECLSFSFSAYNPFGLPDETFTPTEATCILEQVEDALFAIPE